MKEYLERYNFNKVATFLVHKKCIEKSFSIFWALGFLEYIYFFNSEMCDRFTRLLSLIIKGGLHPCIVKLNKFYQIFSRTTAPLCLLGKKILQLATKKTLQNIELCKLLGVFFLEIILFSSSKVCFNSQK